MNPFLAHTTVNPDHLATHNANITRSRRDYTRRLHCQCGAFAQVDEHGRQIWCDTCKEKK